MSTRSISRTIIALHSVRIVLKIIVRVEVCLSEYIHIYGWVVGQGIKYLMAKKADRGTPKGVFGVLCPNGNKFVELCSFC